MPSKHEWSSGLDWRNVMEMIWAFEISNKVDIEVQMKVEVSGGVPDLVFVGTAWDRSSRLVGAPLLASSSVRCLAERCKTMEGVLTFLLYQLDFQLASYELAGKEHGDKP